jgi:hypothetical protein
MCVVLKGTPQESFDQTFSKVCREPTTKRRSLVATSEILKRRFSFANFSLCAFRAKEKSGQQV